MSSPPAKQAKTSGLRASLRNLIRTARRLSLVLVAAGAIALAGGSVLYLSTPELRASAALLMVIGALLILTSVSMSLAQVVEAITGRRGRFGTNTALLILLVLTMATLLNFIALRSPTRIDLTATRRFTLSHQTTKVLKNLEQPIRATAFFVPTDVNQIPLRSQADDLLYEYGQRTKNFTFRFIDPEAQPSIARQYEVSSFPAIVFETTDSGKRQSLGERVSEQDFTSAILIVTGEKQKKIYFVTGHQEKNINDMNPDSLRGMGFARQGLLADNYQVEILNFKKTPQIPDDASALVIAGPTVNMDIPEIEIMDNFFRNGGKAVIMLEHDVQRTWKELLESYALTVSQEGTVVDELNFVNPDKRSPVVQNYPPSFIPIASDLDYTFFIGPLGMKPTVNKLPSTIAHIPIALTTPLSSWIEKDPDEVKYEPGRDQLGPEQWLGSWPIGLVIEAIAPVGEDPPKVGVGQTPPKAQIVVFADGDFASNKYFYASSNGDLFLNAVNWLAQDVQLISIRPKPFPFRFLVVTAKEFDFIRYTSWFLLPSVVALIAGIMWWRRR